MRQWPTGPRRWEWRNRKKAQYCYCTAFSRRSGSVQCHISLGQSAFLPLSLYMSSVTSYCQTPPFIITISFLWSCSFITSFPFLIGPCNDPFPSWTPIFRCKCIHFTVFPLSGDLPPVLFAHCLWISFLFTPTGRANLILRESDNLILITNEKSFSILWARVWESEGREEECLPVEHGKEMRSISGMKHEQQKCPRI